jgi:uncharacterized membrane protein
MTDTLRHIYEFCLGLPHDFLQQQGDWSLQFNPVWPKIPFIDAGGANWLMGLAAVAGLLFVILRPPGPGRVGAITRLILSPFRSLLSVGATGILAAILRLTGIAILYAFLLAQLEGAVAWNCVLAGTAAFLVFQVYRLDGRSLAVRLLLGGLRTLVLALILFLLNRPMVTLGQSRTEPSVLAVLIDDSSSMRVPDVGPKAAPQSRLGAVQDLFTAHNAELLRTLAKTQSVRLYKFDRDAQSLADIQTRAAGAKQPLNLAPVTAAIDKLAPEGQSTQVLPSILTVLQDLQGQRVAGVVLLTDGRDTPAHNIANGLDALKNYGVKVFPIAVGSEQQPRNIEVQSMQLDDVAFKGDIVNVKAIIRATGYEPNHPVHVVLKDKKTGIILPGVDGRPSEKTINIPDDKPVEVELQWKTSEIGNKDVAIEAVKQPGELDESDNQREAMVSVLDAKITVLFVDGYPRWEYRYLKNEMIRDKTISVSCLLASADSNFLQEGNKPLPSSSSNSAGHFPDTIEQLMEYDVIIIGDVDPRYFSDNQLQLINEFVTRGGGFEMVAGERYSPQAYRNTPIEPILPVSIGKVESTDVDSVISEGFRPVVTKAGQATSIFRFFADKEKNEDYLRNQIQPIFWYCHGITAKPSVGEVLAEHPTDLGPDGHKAPILVAGRYGGRTLFSAIDGSWRWRFYTGESVFDTYWVQQLRYLARNRKIGERRLTLTDDQPVYELGGQVRLTLRVIDPSLLRQLPDQIRVQVKDADGNPVRTENLIRQDGGDGGTYSGSFTADKVGKFSVQLPPIVSGVDMMEVPMEVTLPRMELNDPRVDRVQLSRLASETLGKPIEFTSAAAGMEAIPSVAKRLPIMNGQPLWNAPVMMVLFVLLIGTEWVTRKVYGMI